MDFLTHLLIAGKIKRIVKKELNIKLNSLSFYIGNIKPDFSSKYIQIEHYKRVSNFFLQDEIHQIMNSCIFDRKCTRTFSERLGIITHYLSDFFCYAHSDYFTGSMTEHYMYEIGMLIKYVMNINKITDKVMKMPIEIRHNKTSICEYIEVFNEKYISVCDKNFPETDMIYTLNVCIFLCLSIITVCNSGEEKLSNVAYS
jgi:hypothetical protein